MIAHVSFRARIHGFHHAELRADPVGTGDPAPEALAAVALRPHVRLDRLAGRVEFPRQQVHRDLRTPADLRVLVVADEHDAHTRPLSYLNARNVSVTTLVNWRNCSM